jgi:3-oxoadipate enol-lactonase
MMRRAPALGAAAALRGRAERPSYDAVLGAVAVPALIVVGDEDAFTTRDDAEQMRTLLTNSRLLWLPQVGHLPNLEQPDAFNAALLAFLASLPA